MAERARRTNVTREVVSRVLGLWCTDCALPSGILAYIAVCTGARMHLQTHRICDDCRGRNVTVEV